MVALVRLPRSTLRPAYATAGYPDMLRRPAKAVRPPTDAARRPLSSIRILITCRVEGGKGTS